MPRWRCEVLACRASPQARLAEEHHASLLLDACRRAYYSKARRQLKENVLKADTGGEPVPEKELDPGLQSAPP